MSETYRSAIRAALIDIHNIDNDGELSCLPSCDWVRLAEEKVLAALRSPEHLRQVAERIAESMTDSTRHSFQIVTGRELSKSVANQFQGDLVPGVVAILAEAFGGKE